MVGLLNGGIKVDLSCKVEAMCFTSEARQHFKSKTPHCPETILWALSKVSMPSEAGQEKHLNNNTPRHPATRLWLCVR